MTRVVVIGAGLVGRRAAHLLATTTDYDVVLVAWRRPIESMPGLTTATRWPNPAAASATVAVIATESARQFAVAKRLVREGTHVICTADDPAQIERLWTLDAVARERGLSVAVGAAYSPGISTLLASWLARSLDDVSVISTARLGTGGPACAREHHRAMSSSAAEIHAGRIRRGRPGSGRELVWFPEPIGAADCYRAGLADPLLLHRAFPGVSRIESRQAATRRDRLTARLPMLRPPHAEGLDGAVWAEARGTRHGTIEHCVMGATAPQATGAAALVAAITRTIVDGAKREREGETAAGAELARVGIQGVWSAASITNPGELLHAVSNDVHLWTYDGSRAVATPTTVTEPQAARKWQRQRRSGRN